MTLFAFLIPTVLAWLYAMVGGVEFGLPTAWLLSGGIERERIGRYLSPVWEVTNVLAVMALTSLLVLFPGALIQLSSDVRGPLLLAGGLLLARAVLVLAVFYAGIRRGGLPVLLAVVSLGLAAVLAQIPLRFIVGGQPGGEAILATVLLAVLGSIALATGFLSDQQILRSPLARPARLWLLAAMASLAWVVVAVLPTRPDLIIDPTFSPWWWALLIVPFAAFLVAAVLRRARGLLVAFVAASGGWWLFLFVHQKPYFFYPTSLLSQAIGNPLTTDVAVWSTIGFTVILLPVGIWLYRGALNTLN